MSVGVNKKIRYMMGLCSVYRLTVTVLYYYISLAGPGNDVSHNVVDIVSTFDTIMSFVTVGIQAWFFFFVAFCFRCSVVIGMAP